MKLETLCKKHRIAKRFQVGIKPITMTVNDELFKGVRLSGCFLRNAEAAAEEIYTITLGRVSIEKNLTHIDIWED